MSLLNPVKIARASHNMTQKELALLSKVTEQVVVNSEAGLYHKLPASITTALEGLDTTIDWEKSYKSWVTQTRRENARHFATASKTNWVDFREAVYPTFRGFCRLLVFQPSMLQEYEKKGYNRGALNTALRQCGVPRSVRTELLYAGK